MDATLSSSETRPAKPPVTSTAASVLALFWQSMGMTPPTKQEMENVPPWTEEEASAFERRISEAFEQVEDDDYRL